MNADGSDRRRIGLEWGSWSGDGERIVGTRGSAIAAGDIYVVDLARRTRTRLTSDPVSEWGASFVPTREISFLKQAHERPYFQELWLMREDGSGSRLIGRTIRGHFWHIAWSPDGSRVAVAVLFGDDDTSRLVVIAKEGEPLEIDERSGVSGRFPVWSPDATTVAFTRGRFPRGDVWTLDSASSRERRVTRHSATEYPIAWLPARSA